MRTRSRLVLALQMLPFIVAVLAFRSLPGRASGTEGATSPFSDHAVVSTTNHTRYESWVDISWSYAGQPWHIDKAFCLKPNESHSNYHISYNHPLLQPQVRVRAEIKLHGCASGTHTVVSGDGTVTKFGETFTAGIYEKETSGQFYMQFVRSR